MSIELFRTLRIEDPAHLGFAYRVALCRIRHREATDRRGTRVVMEGCDAAIPASEGMENSPETSRRGLQTMGENVVGLSAPTNKSLRMPDPNSSKGTSYLIGSVTQSYCEEADGDLYCLGVPSGFCAEPDNP